MLNAKVPIEQKALVLVNNKAVGSTYVDQADRIYRCEGLFAAAKSNIPITSLCELDSNWVEHIQRKILDIQQTL